MKTSTMMSVRIERLPVRIDSNRPKIAEGRRTTIPAKMMSEIPLPMPLSVICSPSHMMKIVPVVSVRTVSSRKLQPPCGMRWAPPGVTCFSSHSAMPVAWMKERSTVP